jgi:TonB-linked SusC/RagA family outer membrane protein
MNQNLRKTALLAGVCAVFGLFWSPQAKADSAVNTVQSVQQDRKVTGTVVDAMGPVIGASILEKGTSNGTVTDLDGNYTLSVKPGATLVISYIGYKTQEIKVGNSSRINVTLEEDNTSLDEVVVVGYGVQKKKLVTGATVEVKGEDVAKLNTTQVLGALQSQSPGVTIQAISGQPGDGFKVAIRGAGTNGDTKPLYVIDGVAGGDINNLNPADIERIDVLKDAASCAIYGSAAANGVILVTTKQGKQGKIQVSYDGNIGWSNIYRLPQMLTAKEYMNVMDLVRINSGDDARDWTKYVDADLLAAYQNGSNPGTNWIESIRNENAITTSHALNVAGGSELSKFSMGLGYQYQDGAFGGVVKTDFRRFTIRLNSEHVLYRNSKGMDVIKIGENLYYQHRQNQGIQLGTQYANDLSNMLRANPLIPMYNKSGDYFMYDDLKNSGTEGWFGYNQFSSNPVAVLVNSQGGNNKSKSFGLNTVGYIEIQPINGLVYRGQISYNQSSWGYRDYLPTFHVHDQAGGFRNTDSSTNSAGLGWGWSTTNTLNYKFALAQKHNFDVLVGTEYGMSKPDYGFNVSASNTGSIFGDLKHAYMDLFKNTTGSVSGSPYGDSRSMSYFGRLNYDYNETYMLSAIIRADGSSVFAPGHRWGYFPSVSAGWVVSNEKFMEGTSSWLDFLKLRAGWGQNGNKNIAENFGYLATFQYGAYGNYSFNSDKDNYTSGAYPSRLANEKLTWETSEQLDLGLDARFVGGKLGMTFDWYQKTTKDLLVYVPIAPTTGFSEQLKNAGTVRNTGVEFALNWRDEIGKDFTYGINYNIAYNKNKVTKVNSERKYNEGGSDNLSQGTGIIARFEEGQPIGYFYGFKTLGVIQDEADLQNYIKSNCKGYTANSLQGESLQPGDLMFADVNGDGVINSADKTYLGDPHPDVTMGLSLNAAYKGFDISVTGFAALGQQVARSYRKFADGEMENYTTEVYSYWTGPGTSNKYPRLAKMSEGANWMSISDIYIEDAGYFRLQNLTLGYDLKSIWKSSPFQQLRVYFAAQNLFTITKYKGMDPENGKSIANEAWVTGVDVGNYPQPRTYMVGVNVKF